MQNGQIILAITHFLSGLLISGLSIPLILNKIGPNNVYGFRIPKAFESENNWYRINKYGGKLMFYWGLILILSGLLIYFVNPYITMEMRFTIIFFPFILIVPIIIMVLRFAKKL